MYRKTAAVGLALVIGLGGATSANAGLLDFIFGWRNRTDMAPAAAQHPTVTIQAPAKPRRAAKAKPKAAPVQISPKDMLARTIDPARNPNWWLEDPTLRKGDILVLTDRVLVFTGGPLGAPKSYAALEKTKLLSRKERLQVAMMTGRGYEPPMLANASPRQPTALKSASLGAPVQPQVLGQTQAPRS